MKVILLSNVENVGLAGDVANVKNGYYRNFLGPRQIAVEATDGNLKMMEARRKSLRAEAERQVAEAKDAGAKLRDFTVTFTMKAGANDRLFGSVTSQDIADRLTAEGHPVDKRQVVIPYAIKQLGNFSATVKVHTHVQVPIRVVVLRERTEEEILDEAAALEAAEADAAESDAAANDAPSSPETSEAVDATDESAG
jgi:large subunit ribosomal protein L9